MKKTIIFILLLITVVIGTYGGCESGSGGAVIGEPGVTRSTFEGEESEIGSITIPFFRSGLEGLIVNAGIDLNGDGTIASYDAGSATQEEWIIQNSLLPITDTEYTVEFDLVDQDVQPGDSVLVIVTAGSSEVADPWEGAVPDDALSFEDFVVVGIDDNEILADPAEGAVGIGFMTSKAEAQGTRRPIGEPKDDIGTGPDKVGEIFIRRGLPDSRQQNNHCVGNSIANSLSWLSRKCGFEDKFVLTNPETSEPFKLDMTNNIDVDTLAAELIKIYQSITGATLTTPNDQFGGVVNEFILQGKEKITTTFGLPIMNMFLSRSKGEFKFNDIVKFMKDGCDVELVLTMLDIDTGSPSRQGHAVTMAGYVDKGSGNRSFIVHDPASDHKFNELFKLSESQAGGLTFTYTFLGKRRTALVDHILVECCKDPVPSPSPGIPPPPTPEPTPVATPIPTPQPTPEPVPQPTPQPAKQEGLYQSVNGSCGIQSFTLNVSSEGNLILMNFGENGGNVTFAKTENPDVFQSIRPNGLIILGADGHQCTMTCGENNTISLVCVSQFGSCVHNFQLQPQ